MNPRINNKIAAFGVFVQSLLATLGSLYYSNFGDIVVNIQSGEWFPVGAGLEPCQLCWWARILMYPIVGLSYIALVKRQWSYFVYIRIAAFLGILLEMYHYAMQKFDFANPFGCTLSNPCDALKVDYFDFITIPFLCLVAFVVVFILSLLVKIDKQ